MFSKTMISSILAFTAVVSAVPLAATASDNSCASSPLINGLYYAVPPKNYLYDIQCSTATTGTTLNSYTATDIFECTTLCDGWTSGQSTECKAASFQTGQTATNCYLMGVANLAYNSNSGWETATLSGTKLS